MAMFIVLSNIALFILTAFYSEEKFIRNAAIAGASLSGLALGISFFSKKARENGRLRYLPLTAAVVTWAIIGNWWAVVLCASLTFLYAASQRQLQLGIDKEGIIYPSLPQRSIRWNELNNLVLKDGLLTIDFKNDKLLQTEIIESSARLNEQEFNDFCKAQLK